MTGNLILDSLISLAAIGLMVATAFVFFGGAPVCVTEDKARERLAFDEPDFAPVRWLVDARGRAALAEGAGGDYALVSRLGIDLVTRRFPAGGVRAAAENGELVVRPGDPGSRKVALEAPDEIGAADWARKLTAAEAR